MSALIIHTESWFIGAIGIFHWVKKVENVWFCGIGWIKEADFVLQNHWRKQSHLNIMIMMSNCNQDGHFGHNCAALINNYNGSFVLFYSDKLLPLTGLSVKFDTKFNLLCSYIKSINVPSTCVCLCFTLCDCAPCWSSFSLWTASNLSVELESSKWHAGSVKHQSLLVMVLSAT